MLLVLPDELEILRDMQPLDRDVFNYLAERVDYETGLIGRPMRVSHGGIALDLSERDQARRARESLRKLTSVQVENSIKRLVAVGLLDRLSKFSRGCDLVLLRVFWVQLFSTDSTVQNPDAKQMPSKMLLLKSLFDNKINSLSLNKKSTCETKNDSDATTLTQQQQQGSDRFLMNLDWQPTENELAMILHRGGGFRIDQVKPEWVGEFVTHWWGEGVRRYSQREWTAKLGARLVDYFRQPGLFDQLRGSAVVKQAKGDDSRHYPDWARVPKDDYLLVDFMRRFGYGDAPIGADYRQTRAILRRAVDVRLADWKKGLS